MNISKILFPAPKPNYSIESHNFIPIPRRNISEITKLLSKETKELHEVAIPCMFFPCTEYTDKIMIYFHANAEDAALNDEIAFSIKGQLKVHILCIEYPGYSVYKGKPDENKMCEDSVTVFDYLVIDLKISPENIYLMGRSMGSGPSVY